MTMVMVRNVLPLLNKTKLVWLSGFGEPLLHPELLPIISRKMLIAGRDPGT